MKIESFSIGGRDHANEDRLVVQDLPASGVAAILADGLGGLSLGNMAACVITQSIVRFLAENDQKNIGREILYKALEYADDELRRVSIEKKSKMGAAVAVAIVRDGKLHCTWQGNVRIYVCHQEEMKLLTLDHIAHVGYGKTALTRCIKGAGLRDDVPYQCHQLAVGDRIFICTDGLYRPTMEYLSKLPIEEIKTMMGIPEDDASIIQITLD